MSVRGEDSATTRPLDGFRAQHGRMSTPDRRTTPPRRPPIGLLLRKLDRLITERFEQSLADHDITRRQWQLLNTLAEKPATSAELDAAIAPFLDRATGEVSRVHLAPLLARGFVAEDGGQLALTDSGVSLHERIGDEVESIRAVTARGIGEAEYDLAMSTLERMVENLSR